MSTVIKVENLSKQYRLGDVGTGTISHDLNRWWAKLRGKEDPTLQLGETNDRSSKGNSDYVWALKGINFEVKAGEVLGIIGRNGAGKSTLLKILSKTSQPTTGTVKLKGRVASLLEVGTGFHPDLSGRDNIFLNGAILGMTKREIQSKFDEIVDFSGVERYIDTPVKRYSSGMYVRLAFAVAAHLEPEILIVDEVLAVGDAEFQKKCLGKMKDVSVNDGRTVLFVSHNMGAIEALCTKCFILNKGGVFFYGNTQKAISNYISINSSTQIESNEIFATDSYSVGTGEVKVISIEFQDIDGNLINSISAGQPMQIIMKFINKFPNRSYTLVPGIAIQSALGTNVSLHHSRLVGKVFHHLPEKGEFRFIINIVPLVPTIYYLSYSLVNEGAIIDSVSSNIQLDVIESNFYGFGESVPSSNGLVLLEGTWDLK